MNEAKWLTIDLKKLEIVIHQMPKAKLNSENYKLIDEIQEILKKYKKEKAIRSEDN